MKSGLRSFKTGLLFFVLIFSNKIYSQSGTLDAGFGNGGKVTTEVFFKPNAWHKEQIQKLLIQKNQKIVAAGVMAPADGGFGIVLTRYNTDGSLDKSFGKKGETEILRPVRSIYCADAVLQSNDKILVAGGASGGYFGSPLLMRFTKNGAIDSSFGINGHIDTTGRAGDNFYHLATLGDNSVIAVGSGMNFYWDSLSSLMYAGSAYFFIEKYSQKGIKDTNFGVNGRVILRMTNQFFDLKFIGIQNSNKIIISKTYYGQTDSSYLIQLTSSGKYDPTFGNAGKVLVGLNNHSSQDTTNSVNLLTGIRNDGKIISVIMQNSKSYLQYYNVKGIIDSSFGINGKALINDSMPKYFMQIQNDNKIVFGGNFWSTNSYSNFAISRVNADGTMDSSFGNNGITITDFNVYSNPLCIAMQQDKKILMGGYTYQYNVNGDEIENFALARYNNDTTVNHLTKTTSIQNYQIEKSSVRIYPNPAESYIQIDGLKDGINSSLMVTDINGKNVLDANLSSSVYKLNIQNLASGVYYIVINQDGKITRQKFIKQ